MVCSSVYMTHSTTHDELFSDKPWNVGDEFENETTGVVYRYDGIKWVATQDSDPLVEYLPLSGGTDWKAEHQCHLLVKR